MSPERPRFRRDLEARSVSSDGQHYIDVSDHITGKSFRFYDFEYQVALAFDGLALDKVIPWVKLATGLALQVDQLREFARRLDELGFLEHSLEGLLEVPTESAPAGNVEPLQEQEAPQRNEAPTDEEIAGPPPPDLVVMRPGEVVGETPPPVLASLVLQGSTDQPSVDQPSVGGDRQPAQQEPTPPGEEGSRALRREPQASEDGASADQGRLVDAEKSPSAKPSHMDSDTAEPLAAEERLPVSADVHGLGSQPDDLPAPVQHPARAQSPDSEQAEVPAVPGSASSSAFPVLPVTHPAPGAASPPVTPSPWSTPRPLMTPGPSTLGPSASGDRSSSRRKIRRSLTVFGTLGVLAAAALLAIASPFLLSSRRPQPVAARTVTATPGTVYRYFEGAGIVSQMPGVALKFPAGGKVVRIAAAGLTVAPGDVVAAVEAAVPLLDGLARQRERAAYYRQMVEAMHQVGSSKEEERQLAKLESRNARVAQTLSELAQFALVASSAGEVEEAFAREGQAVEAGSPAVRLRSPGYSATFDLGRTLAAAAKRLGFCQVEVEGYVLDCNPLLLASDEGHVTVALPAVPATLVGKMAHLVRGRYRNAIVVPSSALQTRGAHTAVLVVSAGGRLERRPVAIADHDALEAIVVQGLDAGDLIVVEQSTRLRPGVLVSALP